MCNQAVGLVAAELERRGIASVCIALLRLVAERVRAPRTLFAPFPHGVPLERPGDPARQKRVIEAALALLEHSDGTGPLLADLPAFPGNPDATA